MGKLVNKTTSNGFVGVTQIQNSIGIFVRNCECRRFSNENVMHVRKPGYDMLLWLTVDDINVKYDVDLSAIKIV